MIQRIVCFKFKRDTSTSDKETHMNDFRKLKNTIPQILTYSGGTTVPGDFNSIPEYEVMHYLTFNNENDVDTYFNHEEHQKLIENNKNIWEKVLVINSIIES